MSYEYDIFLSYPRRNPILRWVEEYFSPLLEDWLGQSMPEEPRIFRDTQSIEVSDSWPLVLQKALLRSKICVAVLSPSYFRSDWCQAEWTSMRLRESLLGLRTPSRPEGLIYPVCFHDGEHFSEEAKSIQARDLRPWNRPSPAFPQTVDYHDFIGEMQSVAEELAQKLPTIPDWQDDFPVELPSSDSAEVELDLPRL